MPPFTRSSAALACLGLAGSALAAGGHHAVDDAAVLAPGECQLEAWAEPASSRQALHLGPACRVGAVELGVAVDRTSPAGASSLRTAGLQLKWATELWPSLSAGLAWSAAWQSARPHDGGQALLLPVSWAATPEVTLHVNIGRDFRPAAADTTRRGAALEGMAGAHWQGLAEWWHDGTRPYRRLGLRHLASARLSVDLSRAEAVGDRSSGWWTVGLTWAQAR